MMEHPPRAGKGRMTVFFPVGNARTMDFNANDVGYVPSNAPHYIENMGDTELVFLETFASEQLMDVSLNQWLRRVPSEMLKAHLNIDKETTLKIPAENWRLSSGDVVFKSVYAWISTR